MFEVIAMLAMLVDHIGKVFFPVNLGYFIIGRLALPLYTYGIIQGFLHTSSFRKYLMRLLVLALISQPFYNQLLTVYKFNIIFTYIALLLLFKFLQLAKLPSIPSLIIVFFLGILLEIAKLESGLYVAVLAYFYLTGSKLIFKHATLNLLLAFHQNQVTWWWQSASIIATVLIVYTKNKRVRGKARSFYRAFYPLHLAVIWLIKTRSGI